MALITSPFAFANSVDTLTGTPPAVVPGITFTTGSANTDGTAVTVLSALAFDVHYLVIGIAGTAVTGGVDCSTLIDILVDPAGGTSWSSFIDDLSAGFLATMSGTNSWPGYFHFPVYVAAGSSIGLRARSNNGSLSTGKVIAWAYGNPNRPDMWWCGQKVETVGVTPTTSKGTNVTPGASGTYGSWTTIGVATTGRWGAYQIGVNGSDSAPSSGSTFWQIGANSTQLAGTQTIGRGIGSTALGCMVMPGPCWCDIPEGTTLQLRATFDNAAVETITASIYGVY
jgi:hypothetical protein